MAQLEAQDQRVVEVSAQLQQSQADFMAGQRQLAQLSDQLAAMKTKLQSTEKTKTQLTEIVQNQEQEAAEMAEQIQELEGDRQQLQVANEDLDLAEDRIGHLQDALQELRDSIKVSVKDADSQRQQYQADTETRAQADKAVHQDEMSRQARTIEVLEEAVARQAAALQNTQAQLEATQSSLIDLEDHLTTLEEDGDDDDDDGDLGPNLSFPSPSTLQPNVVLPPPGAIASVSQDSRTSQRSDADQKNQLDNELKGKSSPASGAPGRDDAVQAAFVSTMDSLFPPAQQISDEDAAAAEQMLCEDPYELFERSKAALQARAEQQSAGREQPVQPSSLPDLAPGQQTPASTGSRSPDNSESG